MGTKKQKPISDIDMLKSDISAAQTILGQLAVRFEEWAERCLSSDEANLLYNPDICQMVAALQSMFDTLETLEKRQKTDEELYPLILETLEVREEMLLQLLDPEIGIGPDEIGSWDIVLFETWASMDIDELNEELERTRKAARLIRG